MKTKYDIGETVLVPCKVSKIVILPNVIKYTVIPDIHMDLLLEALEDEIHNSMCKEEVRESEAE